MRKPLLAALPVLLLCAILSTAQGGFDSKGKDDKVRKLTDEERLTLVRGLSADALLTLVPSSAFSVCSTARSWC